ncbi:MAG: hypothetical protein LUE27_04815 [Clostridia bacterium]|nr:hypothetical protein [Clostridia bacterium]
MPFRRMRHEGSDGDASAFAEGIQNTPAYDGSFTLTANYKGSESSAADGEKETDSGSYTGKVTYDAPSGAVVMKCTSGGSYNRRAQNMYYVMNDDGNLTEYPQSMDMKSANHNPANGMYSSCTNLADKPNLATAIEDGTTNDVKEYMLTLVAISSSYAPDSTLKVSKSRFTLTYSVKEDDGSESISFIYRSGSNGLKEMSCTYEAPLGDKSDSVSASISETAMISYSCSCSSGKMPRHFNVFA